MSNSLIIGRFTWAKKRLGLLFDIRFIEVEAHSVLCSAHNRRIQHRIALELSQVLLLARAKTAAEGFLYEFISKFLSVLYRIAIAIKVLRDLFVCAFSFTFPLIWMLELGLLSICDPVPAGLGGHHVSALARSEAFLVALLCFGVRWFLFWGFDDGVRDIAFCYVDSGSRRWLERLELFLVSADLLAHQILVALRYELIGVPQSHFRGRNPIMLFHSHFLAFKTCQLPIRDPSRHSRFHNILRSKYHISSIHWLILSLKLVRSVIFTPRNKVRLIKSNSLRLSILDLLARIPFGFLCQILEVLLRRFESIGPSHSLAKCVLNIIGLCLQACVILIYILLFVSDFQAHFHWNTRGLWQDDALIAVAESYSFLIVVWQE